MKKIILFSFLVCIFLFSNITIAQVPSIILPTTEVSIYNIPPNNKASIEVQVKNNLDRREVYSVSIFPTFWNNVIADLSKNLLEIEPKDSENLVVSFTATPEAKLGAKAFTISVVSTRDRSINSNRTIILNVLRASPVFIFEVKAEKLEYIPEEEVKIISSINNIGSVEAGPYSLRIEVRKGDRIVERFDNFIESIEPRSVREVENSLTLGKYAEPGSYSIIAELRNEFGFIISKKISSFSVKEFIVEPEIEKEVKIGFLSSTTTLKAKNEGNVEANVRIIVTLPKFIKDLFVPEITPSFIEERANSLIYVWEFSAVKPGAEVSLSYRYILWHVWLALIVIGAIVFFSFKFVFSPSIYKSARYGGISGEILVTLEVKNRSLNEIKDVVVIDNVPSIAKVIQKFETIKPKIKESSSGTELTWKFDSLKSKEERILIYRIKPAFDITGNLILPNAQLRYSTRKREKKFVLSNSVSIKIIRHK